MFNVNVRQALYILELAGSFTCTWPVDPNRSKREIVFRNILWAFVVLNVTLLLISLLFSTFYFRNDVALLMKTICQVTVLSELYLDLFICKIKCAELQILIGKVKAFLEVANEHEYKIIQGYVDRYKGFFSATAMSYAMTAIGFIFVPLSSPQDFPTDGWIPFSTEPLLIYCMVYANQVYCTLETGFCIGVDFTITVLFIFPAAKLDILGMKLRQVNSYDMLVSCVKEHQEIIGFVDDTKAAVEALLFKTNATMGCAVICGAFPLIYGVLSEYFYDNIQKQSFGVISQFLPLVLGGCAHLYVISWPADDLKESSLRFAISTNDIEWLGKSRKMTSTLMIMMQRSQKMLVITMSGLLPVLTLEYFASFLTTVSSYFMAMRATIES